MVGGSCFLKEFVATEESLVSLSCCVFVDIAHDGSKESEMANLELSQSLSLHFVSPNIFQFRGFPGALRKF